MNTTELVVSNIRSPALRRAVRQLLEGFADRAVERAFDVADARERLRLLVEVIEGRREASDFSGLSVPELFLLSRLLQELQTELLSGSAAAGESARAVEVLEVLRAIERVREKVQTEAADDSFASLLSSLRGPELTVELAHDLRSPLTSILFLAETLRRGQSGELSPLQYRQVGIIYSAALGLVSMAGDVIELARGGKSLVEKKPSPFSIGQTFVEVCDLVRPMVEGKEVALRALPPEGDQRLGFPVALSRVLLNLTVNAIKSTERGFVEIVAEELDGDRVEFSVRDSGSGIDPDTVPHLFEPFRTSATRDRIGFSGTGLGLSICRRLVAAMSGELQFETRSGWGTRFFFVLRLPPAARD